jgi:hypothetical protein
LLHSEYFYSYNNRKKQVVNALDRGLEVNTLSVFNKSIQFDGYQNTFVKLMELGIRECGWLPFQKNIRNDNTGMYARIKPSYDVCILLLQYFFTMGAHSLRLTPTNALSNICLTLYVLQFDGYQNTFVKLMELGIRECGWLPFQKNIRNDNTGMYDEHSTSMNEFSDFMMGFTNLNNISLTKVF